MEGDRGNELVRTAEINERNAVEEGGNCSVGKTENFHETLMLFIVVGFRWIDGY